MELRALRAALLLLGSGLFSACWDSVAMPIRLVPDAAMEVEGGQAGRGPEPGRDGGVSVGDVPNTRYCAPVAMWPGDAARAELALFNAINALRDQGTRCPGRGEWREADPLRLAPELRCVARLQSLAPSYEPPEQRVAATGVRYPWLDESEVTGIEYGQVLNNLRDSQDCFRMMNPNATLAGVGLHGERWTLEFGDR